MTNATRMAVVLGIALSGACGTNDEKEMDLTMATFPEATSLADVDPAALDRLAARRFFFGHQSVGRDLMDGLRRVLAAHPDVGMRVVESAEPHAVEGPALIEARIGRNREPATKAEAFSTILEAGFGKESGAVAMYKYCYVDVLPDTDPDRLFEDYAGRIEALRSAYPELTIVHFTLPLHTAGAGPGEWIRTRLGRPTQTRLNHKRNRYNERLRARYGGVDPVFDLALLESTRPDGSRAFTRWRGAEVFMLAPEYTYDGGHLTEEAQDRLAERFLVFLADLDGQASTTRPPTRATAGAAD